MNDYIPGSDDGFDNWQGNFITWFQGVALTRGFTQEEVDDILAEQAGWVVENPDDPTNILYYLVIILLFSGVILYIAKKGKEQLIKGLILLIFTITMFYIFQALLTILSDSPGVILVSAILSLSLCALLLVYPEWYIVDASGMIIAAGIIAIFGISLTVPLALTLLIILALYDAISVYKTKHMIDLGDTVLKTHLPMLLIIPKKIDYSFRKETKFKGEKNAIFMGLGDFIIPGILAASSFHFQHNLFAAIATICGATAGLLFLMILAESGKPHAGLPWLNGGAIGGYLIFQILSGDLLTLI